MKTWGLNLRGISLLLLASLFAAVVSSCAGTSARTPVSDGQAEEALEEDLREVQDDIPALTEVLSEYFDYVGVAIDRRETREPYSELLNMHFNSITFENDMKPERIQGSPGNFTWNNSDALMEFAEDNDLRVWGHTLVWHSQTPDWFFQDADGNPLTDSPEHQELLLHRMEEHINAIADRYGDSIAAWDVVNEVIDDSQDDYMRRSRWYEILGPDFVAHAFRFAREAFPNAQLYINDYNTEIPSKREAYFSVVEGLLADGVPIDGVGHQLHVNMNIPVSWVNDTIRRFGQLDVRQTVTELDVRISRDDQEQLESAPEERLVLQGYYYRDLFEVFKRHADKLDGITVWGLYDSRSWLRYWPITRNHEAPLLFDDDLQAKHAYWGIVDPSRLPHQSQVT
ncbi:MAG: endo-1,4-beta-xylanase, partial [Spirochaeta sp.]